MKNKKMKTLLVFAPVIFPVVFLLNSFAPKRNVVRKKITNKSVIFKSTDGGQTWKDISKGLPERLQGEGVSSDGLFANERGLYLRFGNGIYHNENSTATFWTTDIFPGERRNIAPGRNGIYVYNFRGQFLKKINGTNNWSPVYTNFQEQAVRLNTTIDWMYKNYKEKGVCTFFESAGGTVFIGSSSSLFRSADSGKTWEQVHVGSGNMKLAELNGVLLATYNDGILRSIDDGKTWAPVLGEGGIGVAVEHIDGGFAAIVHNAVTQTNTVHISMDSGETWSVIAEELQPSWSSLLMKQIGLSNTTSNIFSIKQMGKYLICGSSDGIFRSADMGKTWIKLSLPAVENYGFSSTVAGNVIYVMPGKGC